MGAVRRKRAARCARRVASEARVGVVRGVAHGAKYGGGAAGNVEAAQGARHVISRGRVGGRARPGSRGWCKARHTHTAYGA